MMFMSLPLQRLVQLQRKIQLTRILPGLQGTQMSRNFSQLQGDLKRTGLFGIDQLSGPEGFHILKNEALINANNLVEQIVTQRHHSPTAPKVVALFDELSNSLCKVADLAEFIRVVHPQNKFRASAEQASVAISSLVEKLNTDQRLYQALKNAGSTGDHLDDLVTKLFMFDFEQSGIHLDDDKRNLVLELNESILKLGSIFASNANQGRLVDTAQVPERLKSFFSRGQSAGRSYINGLHADNCDELVRLTAYKLYLQPDRTQADILDNLLQCRQQLAQLCGFPSYAHRAVNGSIAGKPEVVNRFLDILNDQLKGLAAKDYDQMLELKRIDLGKGSEVKLNAWDVPYYSANYKRGIYNETVLQCLPYFSVGVCMDGLNMIFRQLFGIRMQVDNCVSGELWHNDVTKLSIIDEENGDELLGYIYCDFFERSSKQQQDCHHTIRGGCQLRDGTYQVPIVVLVLSLPDSSDGSPSLLSPNMVDNLFHEMGHAMHSMMARTKYQHITGTRCSTDLAEVPSILMEFFASDPRVVSKFARHHATGQSMPAPLIDHWVRSKRVFISSETQLQVFYAALDQAYHGVSCPGSAKTTTNILAEVQQRYYPIPYVEGTAWQLRFAHLISYGAKYYSYLVSRAVAAAIWDKLFAADPLSRSRGEEYKRQVLVHGGGKAPRKIVEDTLGCRVDADFMARSVISSLRQA